MLIERSSKCMSELRFCGIEPLSLVDLEGMLVCTLFTNGCNFRCPFCQNSNLVFNQDITYLDWEEILSFLKKRRNMLDAVCVTGGEPTLYQDLANKLKEIKELGYFIKLDTNGTNPAMIKELYQQGLIDYVAMDIKNCLEKYQETIDTKLVNLVNIQESIDFLKTSGIDYEFRTTLVHEFHTPEDIEKIGLWLGNVKRMYLQKFKDSETCIKQGLHEVDLQTAHQYKKILKEHMNNVSLRGYE